MQAATKSAEAFRSVGDQRNFAFIEGYRGLAEADLGMLEEGEATLRASLALANKLEEVLMATNATLYLALVLARQEGRRREAFALATEILGRNPLADRVAHGIRAEARLHDGELLEAQDLASKAQEMLAAMPTLRLHSLAVGMRVAIAAGRNDDALVTASEGLLGLEKSGGGYNEVLFRVAAAEAFDAAGSQERAVTTIGEALEHMLRRAEKIPNDAARERFCSAPENARAVSLSREWSTSADPSDAS